MALINLPVVAPVVAKAIGVSTNYLGAYVALVYFAAMVATLLGGAAVKRWGAIRLSQAGLLSSATGLFLCAIPHPFAIALGALFIGAGYGPITPASSHLLIKTTPPEKLSFVFSIKQTGVPLGGMIAGALVPSLDIAIGWQLTFISSGVACLLCAWAVQPLRAGLDDDRDPTVKPSLAASVIQPLRLIFEHPGLRALSMTSFLFAVCQMSLMAYLVTFLFEDLGWSLVAAGVALTVAQAGGVTGRILWGYVADRWLGARRMLLLLAGLMALGALATTTLTQDTSQWLVMVILVTFGASAIGWNGVYLAEVARRAPPGMASLATGGTLAFTFLGVVIGPPIFGALSTGFGTYRAGFMSLMVVASVSGLLLFWSQRTPATATLPSP
jgi:predicted MFS family arabinose efflux permease